MDADKKLLLDFMRERGEQQPRIRAMDMVLELAGGTFNQRAEELVRALRQLIMEHEILVDYKYGLHLQPQAEEDSAGS